MNSYDMAEHLEVICTALSENDGAEEGAVFECYAGLMGNPDYVGNDAQLNTLIKLVREKIVDYLSYFEDEDMIDLMASINKGFENHSLPTRTEAELISFLHERMKAE